MADILIEGLELPKKGNIGLMLYSDGSVEICGTGSLSKPLYGVPVKKAIEIPPHGRCIDADALEAKIKRLAIADYPFDALGCCGVVVTAPTVLEAST